MTTLPPAADPAARLAAQDVMVRYAAGLDDRDYDAYRTCFSPEVEFHGFGAEPILGIDAWIAYVSGVLDHYEATQHMLGPPLVRVDAKGWSLRTPLQAQHFHREPKGRIFTLWGTYHTELDPNEGGWWIRRHALQVDHTRVHDRWRADS